MVSFLKGKHKLCANDSDSGAHTCNEPAIPVKKVNILLLTSIQQKIQRCKSDDDIPLPDPYPLPKYYRLKTLMALVMAFYYIFSGCSNTHFG